MKYFRLGWFRPSTDCTWAGHLHSHVARHSHLMCETITGMEVKLNPDRFMRIHRSTIVNLDRVKEVQPWAKGEYVVIMQVLSHEMWLRRSFAK